MTTSKVRASNSTVDESCGGVNLAWQLNHMSRSSVLLNIVIKLHWVPPISLLSFLQWRQYRGQLLLLLLAVRGYQVNLFAVLLLLLWLKQDDLMIT